MFWLLLCHYSIQKYLSFASDCDFGVIFIQWDITLSLLEIYREKQTYSNKGFNCYLNLITLRGANYWHFRKCWSHFSQHLGKLYKCHWFQWELVLAQSILHRFIEKNYCCYWALDSLSIFLIFFPHLRLALFLSECESSGRIMNILGMHLPVYFHPKEILSACWGWIPVSN